MTNTTSQPGTVDARKAAELDKRRVELNSIQRLLAKQDIFAFLMLVAAGAVFFLTATGISYALTDFADSVAPVIGQKVAMTIFIIAIPLACASLVTWLLVRSLPKQNSDTGRIFAQLEKYSPLDAKAYSVLQETAAGAGYLEHRYVNAWISSELAAIQRDLGSPLLRTNGQRFINKNRMPAADEQASVQRTTASHRVDLTENTAALERIRHVAKKYVNYPLPAPALMFAWLFIVFGIESAILGSIPSGVLTKFQELPLFINVPVVIVVLVFCFLAGFSVLRFCGRFFSKEGIYLDDIFAQLESYQPVDRQAYADLQRATENAARFDHDELEKWLDSEAKAIQLESGSPLLPAEGTRFVAKKV